MISVEAGIVVGKKLGHEVGVEFLLDFSIGFFVGDVVDLVRVFLEVVKFESRTWADVRRCVSGTCFIKGLCPGGVISIHGGVGFFIFGL